MECGISTASFFGRCQVEDALSPIARCGARLTEVFVNTFSEYEPDFFRLLLARTRQLGLSVYSVHPHSMQFEPQLLSVYPRQRQDALAIYEKILQGAKLLGAKCYVFHGSSNMAGTLRHPDYGYLGPLIAELADMAWDYGITFTWENVSRCLFCQPEFALRMQDAARTSHLKFTLDVKQAARSGYDPRDFARIMGRDLMNLHLCDYRIRPDGVMEPMLPGRGQWDLAALKETLSEIGYQGPGFLEVYSRLYETEAELAESYRLICRELGS